LITGCVEADITPPDAFSMPPEGSPGSSPSPSLDPDPSPEPSRAAQPEPSAEQEPVVLAAEWDVLSDPGYRQVRAYRLGEYVVKNAEGELVTQNYIGVPGFLYILNGERAVIQNSSSVVIQDAEGRQTNTAYFMITHTETENPLAFKEEEIIQKTPVIIDGHDGIMIETAANGLYTKIYAVNHDGVHYRFIYIAEEGKADDRGDRMVSSFRFGFMD